MKKKPEPSKAMIRQCAERLTECGIPIEHNIPDQQLGLWATGKVVLVVHRGPDKCQCCGKDQVRAVMLKLPKAAVKKLFEL
jgi:hypothetical protein